jgi:membrane-associated phospholipid phosphatase
MNTSAQKIKLSRICGKIRLFLIPYLIILIACLVIKTLYSREEIYFFVNSHYSAWGDVVFPLFTDLGDGWAGIILALLMALFSYRKSFLFITAYGFTALVGQLLKAIFDKPRPYLYFQNQHAQMHLVEGIKMLTNHSFPSGHTITAFSGGVALTYLFKSKYMALPMLLLALCIGYSRMYLSQHFFEDVTAGSAVGVFVTLFWLRWLDGMKFIHQPGWQGGLVRKAR